MPLISIIIPVYNTEIYLRQCLDSVIAQTYTNWECLLIDDGSKDSSGAICDEYAQKDSRFKVFHKENGGVSSARNLGINNMSGEYVIFIDADDELFDYSLSALFSEMKESIGSTVGGFVCVSDNQDSVFTLKEVKRSASVEEAIMDFYKTKQIDWQRYLWNRLFLSKFIKDYKLRFREDIYFKEDGLFLIQYLVSCMMKVGYSDKIVYKYRINNTSATATLRNNFNPKVLTNIYAHKEIVFTIKSKISNQLVVKTSKIAMLDSFDWIVGAIRDKKQKKEVIDKYKPIVINAVGKENYKTLKCVMRIILIMNLPRRIVNKILRIFKIKK